MESTPGTKVLIILPHTGTGGDTQVLYNLLYVLSSDSLKFHLLVSQRGAMHEHFRQFGEVYTFPIDDMKWTRRFFRRFLLPVFVGLKKQYGRYLLRKINPDLVYINTVNEHEFSQIAVRSDKRLIVHVHEMGFVVTQRMRTRWMEALLSKAHIVVSPARAAAEFYRDVYGVPEEKMKLIYETVSEKRLSQQRLKGEQVELRTAADILLIGAVGSVIYRKGVDTFLRACSILKDKLPNQSFEFLWLGGPSELQDKSIYYRALLKSIEREGLQSHFRFLPHSSEVGDFYADLDIFVLPSRMEAFPLVILEACLAEKPVVAMDVAGVREVVDDETGYLVRDQTPEGLAQGIAYFIQNAELRRVAGQNGRKRVLEKYEATVQSFKWRQLLIEATS
ncbi:glycosyltransferase family 4 protein [Salmonirosea aquatica]|uniref:Glycosyltransferase n=1 Tax=Salmonirosea aquatica TaxID=2654236 RepID=A0A7C9F5S2_9BACT|nr:glycosyltransferase [Cytophagaceae bacterium SJW1-29]